MESTLDFDMLPDMSILTQTSRPKVSRLHSSTAGDDGSSMRPGAKPEWERLRIASGDVKGVRLPADVTGDSSAVDNTLFFTRGVFNNGPDTDVELVVVEGGSTFDEKLVWGSPGRLIPTISISDPDSSDTTGTALSRREGPANLA